MLVSQHGRVVVGGVNHWGNDCGSMVVAGGSGSGVADVAGLSAHGSMNVLCNLKIPYFLFFYNLKVIIIIYDTPFIDAYID